MPGLWQGLPATAQTSLSTRRIHTGERPFECNECKCCLSSGAQSSSSTSASTPGVAIRLQRVGRLSQTSNFMQHQRIHTGEKLLRECNECGKAFFLSSYLIRHQKIHTRERVYERKEVGKPFSRKHTSLSTRRSTLGDRPLSARTAGKPLFRAQSYSCTRLFTLERNPMCAVIVGKASFRGQTSSAPEDPH